MNFNKLDLNLLVIFDALMKTRSVTLAGERVGLSQSATSNSLQRLREAFNDPLFVRTPTGMQPSALAIEIEAEVRQALDRLRAVTERGLNFDPASSRRTFRLLLSDLAQMAHMASFIGLLRRDAPDVDVVNLSMPLREAKEAMADGELDIAVGFLPDLGADFHRQSLFAEHWVCVVSRNHSCVGRTLTQEDYLRAAHLAYRPPASIHASLDPLLEAQFSGRGVTRRVVLSVPYTSGMGSIVAASDLILTAPQGLAMSMARMMAVNVVPLPFDLPPIDLSIQWHDRMHRDPGNRWFRQTFAANYCAERVA